MKKLYALVALALFLAAGYWGYTNYTQNPELADLVNKLLTKESSRKAPPVNPGDTVRVASFNIQVFGEKKIQDPRIVDVLVTICRHFDVIAIQEVRSQQQNILPLFVDALNADGSQYDYIIGPRLGRTNSKEQYAFIYDKATIEVDRNQTYTLDDRDDLLHREPLVGWFRVRGPKEEDAFTFTLVNVHTDPDEVKKELDALDDAFFAIRDDGRKEDDLIMLGDFNADAQHLGQLGQIPGLGHVVGIENGAPQPTNTRGDKQFDNILFDAQATIEFTGRGGVFDFMREYNLDLEDALLVSDHLPVWAEFSVFETGRPPELSRRPVTTESR